MAKKLLLTAYLMVMWCIYAKAQVPPPCPSNSTPGAQACAGACVYCNFDGYMGTNDGTPSGGNTVCGQIAIHNDEWFAFVAGTTTISIDILTSNCLNGDGLQAAFFENCQDDAVTCNPGGGGGGGIPLNLTWSGFIEGQTYYLMIDGWVADVCDFEIDVVDGSVTPPAPGNATPPQGPNPVCPGAVAVYTIPDVYGAGYYTWTAPPGSSINGGGSTATIAAPDGTSITVTFGNAGGNICVFAGNACNPPTPPACTPIVNQAIPPTVLPKVTVCNEDLPYELPWGGQVNSSGTYQITLDSYLGCDSIVRQPVTVLPPKLTNLGQKVICEGDCVTICGEQYCEGGNFSKNCETALGCDSTLLFSILELNPVAEITGPLVLSCNTPSIVLNSVPSPVGIKVWRNGVNVIGTGNSITVTAAGTYILTTTANAGGVSCVKADTVVVTGNTIPPTLNAVGGTIGCFNTTVTMQATNNAAQPVYSWTGPGGFTSTQANPTVTVPGTYNVTVTNNADGCSSTAPVVVNANNTPPTASATGATLTCATPTPAINATSSASNSGFSWTGPAPFTATGASPTVSVAGTYTVTVTNLQNGCTSTASAIVSSNFTTPGASAVVTGVISCATPSIVINGGSTSGVQYNWSGPNGYTASTQNATVPVQGTYTVTVQGSNGCTSTAIATVTGDTLHPDVLVGGGTVSCGTPNINVTSSTSVSNPTFAWSGPNAFSSNQQNPQVNEPGSYTVTVTASNQCTTSATASVAGDFGVPNASAVGGIITCSSSTVDITGSSTTPGATFSWAGPGNYMGAGDTVTVNTVGAYTLTVAGPNGCTTTATAMVDPDASIPNATANGATLTCTVNSVTISGASSTSGTNFGWTGPNGFTSVDPNPVVTVPGSYVLTVNNPANGCSAQATAVVDLDDTAPGASITAPTLTCTNPSVAISGSSSASSVTWDWTGPNGFTANTQAPSVSAGGTYNLTVTDQQNGCTSTTSFDVQVDQTAPVATANSGTLTCTTTTLVLEGFASLPSNYNWTGPNSFNSTLANPAVTVGGTYTLVITAFNGCKDTLDVPVPQDIAAPPVTTTGATLSCTTPQVQISASSTAGTVDYAWSGPGGFFDNNAAPLVVTNGTYEVTITSQTNGCTSTSDAQVLIDTTTAALNALASDILTCALTDVDIQTTITPSGASGVQSILWNGPNGFTSTVEDPTVTEPGLYNLLVTMSNGCSTISNAVVDQDILAPDVSAASGTLTCAVTSLGLQGGSITSGATFSWTGPNAFTSNLEDPSVSVGGVYDLVVTGPNGCTAAAQTTVQVNTTAPGAAAVSSNDLDCNDLSTALTATATATTVSYVWNGPGGFNSTIANPSANQPGTYGVTITDSGNGCTSVASVQVAQDIQAPNVSALGDTLDCISGVAVINGNSSTAGVSYAWSGPGGFTSTQQNPNVSVDGVYTLVVTGQNACTASATTSVEKNQDSPQVTLSGGGTLTCAVTSLNMTGTITTQGASGIWSGPGGFNSTQPTVSVNTPGTYTYTVTATNGCISAPTMNVPQNIQAPQALTAAGGQIDCNFPTISITSSSSTSGVSYAWTGPGGYISSVQNPNNITNPGTYTVVATNPLNGCTSQTTTLVTQDPTVPDITATAPTITCSLPAVTLDATTNTPNVTYQWSGPGGFTSTQQDPANISTPGTYTVVAKASSGCTASFILNVVANQTAPGATAQGDTITCTAQSATIVGTSGTNNVNYSWSGPGGFTSAVANPTVTLVGNYVVTVTGQNGCTSTAQAVVAPDINAPQITVTGGTISCLTSNVNLAATSNVQVNWQWSGPGGFTSTQQNPNTTQPGAYVVIATAANGCSVSSGATVIDDTDGPVLTTTQPSKLTCTTTQVNLGVTVQGTGSFSYGWSTANGNILSGNNTQAPTVNQAGLYAVVVTNNVNGCTSTANVTVNVDTDVPSAATLQVKDVNCYGETNGAIFISDVTGGSEPYLYRLGNQAFTTGSAFTSLPPGNYPLTIQDANGCEYNTNVEITQPDSLFVFLGDDINIHLGETITLSVQDVVNQPDRIDKFVVDPAGLFPGGLDTVLTPTYTLRYTVTAVDTNGCKASDSRLVIVRKNRLVYIPNIFDPSSSSGNEFFYISTGIDVEMIEAFQVYDRWGSLVHTATDILPDTQPSDYGWDGKVNGSAANPAVFIYYAKIRFKDGETELFKGDVLLQR